MENHHITIDNRQRMTITLVADVDAFDEETLWANLKEGGLEITGHDLNIEKLDLEQGLLVITGEICSLSYTDRKIKEKKKAIRKDCPEMTELIQEQLGAIGLMVCGGMAAGLVYELFARLAELLRKTDSPDVTMKCRVYRILSGMTEVIGLLLIGWCSSIFLFYSSEGKITMQGIASYIAGLWIWKKQVSTKEGEKEYGKEREQAAGIREESSGTGHIRCTERAEREKSGRRQQEEAEASAENAENKKKRRKISWVRITGLAVCTVFLLVVGISVKNIYDLKGREADLQKENQKLEQIKEELTVELENVNTDEYIEEKARRELKLIRPNELVFYFPDDFHLQKENKKESEE